VVSKTRNALPHHLLRNLRCSSTPPPPLCCVAIINHKSKRKPRSVFFLAPDQSPTICNAGLTVKMGFKSNGGEIARKKRPHHTMNISRMMLNEYLLIVLLLAQILTHGASARYETRNIVDEDDYFSRNISNHVYINYGKSASCLGYVNTSLSSDSFQIKPPVVCGGGFGGSSSRMVTFKRKYAMHRALPTHTISQSLIS
jgi:hypothetical protein